jgi:hypothetical protein
VIRVDLPAGRPAAVVTDVQEVSTSPEHWLGALRDVLADKRLADPAAVAARAAEVAARPAEHDHDLDHHERR